MENVKNQVDTGRQMEELTHNWNYIGYLFIFSDVCH